MTRFSHQRGVTLVMTLTMLLLITILSVAMIRLSTSNLKIAGNMQVQRALEATAQQVIEADVNSANFYNDQIKQTGPWANGATTKTSTANGFSVTLKKPRCLGVTTASGYSALAPVGFEDTFWEVEATATDSVTGGAVDVVQGIDVTLTKGNCIWP